MTDDVHLSKDRAKDGTSIAVLDTLQMSKSSNKISHFATQQSSRLYGDKLATEPYLQGKGLVIVEPSGRIVEVDSNTENIFGYRQPELISQMVEILFVERLRQEYRKQIEAFFQGVSNRPAGIKFYFVGRHKEGAEFPVEMSLTYAPRRSLGVIAIAPVTDRTNSIPTLNEPLWAKNANSPARLEVINSLTAILNNAEAALLLLSNNNPEVDESKAAIQDIISETWRMIETIHKSGSR